MANKKSLLSRREILRADLLMGSAATAGLASRPARAADYPERPMKIIVPFACSGPTDIMARILTTPLGDAIGGSFIVENKPGAGGNIGIGAAAHAVPDCYTLLVTSSAYVVNPGLYTSIPFDVAWQGFNASFHEADGITKSAIAATFFPHPTAF
jgi:tripartite-type tricarboxylate transporter receptor subunit TctC